MHAEKDNEFVQVAVRIQPTLRQCDNIIEVNATNPNCIVIPEKQLSYSFDHIFDCNASQHQIFDHLVKPLVNKVFLGYNSTIFAYGQTGSGKTYTIGSNPSGYVNDDAGLITRCLEDILSENNNAEISASFIEIYNEKVYDLLGNNNKALPMKGLNLIGVTKHSIANLRYGLNLLVEGGKKRHTGGTKLNSKSSRSHAIFYIYCKIQHLNHTTNAKLHFVDLAGSESIKRTGNEGSQLHEAININKGLLSIGRVINALSSNDPHVPYRDSTITTILQDSLNKNNFITLIACIGSNAEDLSETVQTLDFSQSTKRFRNRPRLNNSSRQGTQRRLMKSVSKTTLRNDNVHQFVIPETPKCRTFHKSSTNSDSAVAIFNSTEMCTPLMRAFMDELEERLINRMTAILPTARHANTTCVSRDSLQREVTNIVRKKAFLDSKDASFRNEANSHTANLSQTDRRDAKTHASLVPILDADCITLKAEGELFKVPQVPIKRVPPVRRSMRIIARNNTLNISQNINISITEKIPTRRSVRRLKHETKHSPVRSKHLSDHSKNILTLVNLGKVKDLTKLQTIGPKTAAMICDFRKHKGKFKNISDLKDMPWRGNGYERFLTSNFLTTN